MIPTIAPMERTLYCIALFLLLASLSVKVPTMKTIAVKAIQGTEVQKPMDFKDRP